MKTDDPVNSTNGRVSGSPTIWQNASRDWLGSRPNQRSKSCAPVTATRSAGMP